MLTVDAISAVFASGFRTWVLFNYSKKDISYTLTPLLVWSDIEMCAGIISACLPTMRPVVITVAAKLGAPREATGGCFGPAFTNAAARNWALGVCVGGRRKVSRSLGMWSGEV